MVPTPYASDISLFLSMIDIPQPVKLSNQLNLGLLFLIVLKPRYR